MVDGSGQIFTVGTTGLFGPLVMPFFSGSCDTGTRYSNPVSDITDTSAGPGDTQFAHAALKGLLVTERTFVADYGFLNNGSSAHQARVMSFGAASNPLRWVQTPFVYHTGIHIHDSAGGIATDPKGEVWATADAIRARGVCDRLYGLHRIPKSGANPSPFPLDILIDLDHSTINWDKSSPGDVEYYGGPNLPSGCSPCN
jgi:hypothetical protein